MAEIKDYKCTYDNSAGITSEVTANLDLQFPEAYKESQAMVRLSKALKEHDGAGFCELPFCHTVEAEAMGGIINLGDANIGPRAKDYVCSSLEEVLQLPEIDFSKGRIHEVLVACKELRAQGEHVVLEISGPFTILNGLIDGKYIFKGMRKQPELMEQIFQKLEKELLHYMEEAQKYDVDLISYADSSGSVSILGPNVATQVANGFTYGFIKKAEALIGDKCMLLLCPKTTFALLGVEKISFKDVPLETSMRYGEACISMIGTVKIAGQTCIKNINHVLDGGSFKEIVLL